MYVCMYVYIYIYIYIYSHIHTRGPPPDLLHEQHGHRGVLI